MRMGSTAESTNCRSGRREFLVLAPNWLGDAVMATPLLLSLRRIFQDAFICVVCRDYVSEIFQRCSAVDRMLVYRRRSGLGSELSMIRKNRPWCGWDACFVLPPSFSAALAAMISGAKRRFGYRGQLRDFLLTDVISNGDNRSVHLSAAYMKMAGKASGCRIDDTPLPVVIPPYEWKEILERKSISTPYIVLAAGATFGTAKVWPAGRYADLASRLAGEIAPLVVTVGSRLERETLADILESANTNGKNLAGRCTVAELLAVLRGAKLVIGNDSGPVHISAAMGRPTVAVFGSTSPAWTAPRGVSVRIVSSDIECAPCFNRECPEGEPRCLSGIDVDDVYRAALDLIEEERCEEE